MDQAAAEDGYVEGIIPAGIYYKDEEHYFTFYTDEEGGFSLHNYPERGTYTYDPETGIYYLDYDGEAAFKAHGQAGGSHFLFEGYYREEDGCFVETRSENLTIGKVWEDLEEVFSPQQ